MPKREIRCTDGQGAGCGKLLATVDGPCVLIVCPRCGRLRSVPVVELVAELAAYLAEVQAAAEKQMGGKGFLL